MSIDAVQKRRKPFTPKSALALLLVLIGSAATIALPIVLILANRTLDKQNTRVVAQDKEIKRLKAENLYAVSRANDLQEKYQRATAANSSSINEPSGLADRDEVPTGGAFNSGEFQRKLAQLEEKALGGQVRNKPAFSDDFESRLTRLYEKVVLTGN